MVSFIYFEKILKKTFDLIIKGIVLDNNRKHFPSLLIICVILSIILFVFALILSSIHKKKVNLKKTSIEIVDKKYISNVNEEEQQMEIYLNNNQQDN